MTQQNNSKLNIKNSTLGFIPPHPLKTAVLFLVFNRLDTTKQVFEAIRQAKPPRLYIAADGARETKEGEAEKVKAVRDYIISNIDWECEVKTLFREQNFGCGPNVKSSIDWFFENEEMGIILEDDTVPSQSFFYFCEELLSRYKDDTRIAQINGTNHIGYKPFDESYLFSKYKACWGWASWQRAWKNMDFEMNWLKSSYKDMVFENMGYGSKSILHWKNAVKSIQDGKVSAWDWQWYFSVALQGQMTIFPRVNLVSNVGFGDDATHTFGKAPENFIKSLDINFPLKHPEFIMQNIEYDKFFESKKISSPSIKRFIPRVVKDIVKKLLKNRRIILWQKQ